MSVNQPTNLNFATASRFQLSIIKLPNVQYFLTDLTIPEVNFNVVEVPTPFKRYPQIGDELEFGNFTCTFNVDEDFTNYNEIFNWILNISNSQSFERYPKDTTDTDAIFSDATVIVYNSSFNPSFKFLLRNMFPLTLSLNEFSIQNETSTILTASTTFAIESFDTTQ